MTNILEIYLVQGRNTFNRKVILYDDQNANSSFTICLKSDSLQFNFSLLSWLSSRNFFQGGKSIVMQISIVMPLFSDQISGRGTSFRGGKLSQGAPPLWKKASCHVNKELLTSPCQVQSHLLHIPKLLLRAGSS